MQQASSSSATAIGASSAAIHSSCRGAGFSSSSSSAALACARRVSKVRFGSSSHHRRVRANSSISVASIATSLSSSAVASKLDLAPKRVSPRFLALQQQPHLNSATATRCALRLLRAIAACALLVQQHCEPLAASSPACTRATLASRRCATQLSTPLQHCSAIRNILAADRSSQLQLQSQVICARDSASRTAAISFARSAAASRLARLTLLNSATDLVGVSSLRSSAPLLLIARDSQVRAACGMRVFAPCRRSASTVATALAHAAASTHNLTQFPASKQPIEALNSRSVSLVTQPALLTCIGAGLR